ncbi:MAG: OmpH family outer membrane protein [Bacteroidetes bacterium]|uniref:OmpH family outer membrane protein n=1 Tax=Candidatus Cryptobacteroides faecigallinarum TaxID=2840763 RepID=A0A9D9IM09_9BACT|nr:OmpH family outer membrane protein [Candidatus Cryptobacteroides faecigallinarum]
MKKIIVVIAAAALAAVAANAQSYKFAHVNFQELVQLMPEMDSARVQLDAASKEAQETLQAMAQEFDNKYSQYEQKSAEWSAAIRQSKERELSEIQSRIQDFQQSIQQELNQLQNQLMAPIYQKAQEAVTAIAKAAGYIYVFDNSQVLYVDTAQSTDITPSARESLNIPEDRTLESLQQELQAQAAAAQAAQ